MRQLIRRSFSSYSNETPLLKEIRTRILVRGPLSIHEYMTMCLTDPVHGYYTTREAIGKSGDFVTSPEISQTFGEMIGVWCVATWQSLGKPNRFRLVELGGGKGTLMKDIIRTCSTFPKFTQSLNEVNIVDMSENLKKVQISTLGATQQQQRYKNGEYIITSNNRSIPIAWKRSVSEIEPDIPMIVIAQEFFDALPVHQFLLTEDRGWCERLVDIVPDNNNMEVNLDLENLTHHLRFVLSPGLTLAAKLLLGPLLINPNIPKGTQVEVSAIGSAVIQELGEMIMKTSGSVLIIDYGENYSQGETLRGIKDHKFVHPLKEPGLVDLSVDVDFNSLKQSIDKYFTEKKRVPPNMFGPISQGDFLKNLGIEHRVAKLLQNCTSKEQQLEIFRGYQRLVQDMGTSYKVLVMNTDNSAPGISSSEEQKEKIV